MSSPETTTAAPDWPIHRFPNAAGYWWAMDLAPPAPHPAKWIGIYVPKLSDGSALLEWQRIARQRGMYWTPAKIPPLPTATP